MSPSIYLINPSSDFPTYFSADVFAGSGIQAAALMADLAISTIAAMAPNDFDVTLCDENITPIDFDTAADFIGVTGKITQWGRMTAIAREFRDRGKVVLIGGPYGSLCPGDVQPHCDILVRGETEDIIEGLFADLRRGRWKNEYVGGTPDLARSPVPRWDLYPNERALMGTLQTSRGCPFECEFCDVIQYVGRKQRHKPVAHVLRELDQVYRLGYRRVFLADDNFTVYRGRAKELLEALRAWNLRQDRGRVFFVTQVSIDAARDDELLEMCAAAGLVQVFIGIETPNEDSLRETKKRQNLKINLADQAQRFLDHGISVVGGMIVGFDSDGPDIFQRQFQFAMSTPIPIFSVGALVAPSATPLHARMERAGRLMPDGSEVAAMPWSTNIVPQQMTRQQLLSGIQWLCNALYRPEAFGERVLRFVEQLGRRRDPGHLDGAWTLDNLREVDTEGFALLPRLKRLGPGESRMWSRICRALARRPECTEFVIPMLVQYLQIRYMYERGSFWESTPSLASGGRTATPDAWRLAELSPHLPA
ncbi:MAG: B12-binding domain-containing radical SAM protein [candidate division NC10 bacterium]|nr:B12-binding domain-containing radical SAM protein [candidate division NC10 bacterium]